jgi:cell wall-associated NlpC family hydrolase
MPQGQTPGENLFSKVMDRKDSGQAIYDNNKQQNTNRVASDVLNKSAGLQYDEFGKPNVNLANFADLQKGINNSVQQRGNLAFQTAQAKQNYRNAVNTQNLGSYGFSGYDGGASATDIPGASKDNPGAKAVSIAMQAMKNGTNYVYGGNSLSQGVDCSGLVQQAYRQLGINLPRTTYEQAKAGKQVPISAIRPGDLVFYNNLGHVGIYMGNGKIIHAANSHLGIITSNLTNSNGAPVMVLRPY